MNGVGGKTPPYDRCCAMDLARDGRRPTLRGADDLVKGDRIGDRYLVVRRVDASASTLSRATYIAYDPELDREVLLEVSPRDATSSRADGGIADARSLARLAHPRREIVHDAGVVDGRVFVAKTAAGEPTDRGDGDGRGATRRRRVVLAGLVLAACSVLAAVWIQTMSTPQPCAQLDYLGSRVRGPVREIERSISTSAIESAVELAEDLGVRLRDYASAHDAVLQHACQDSLAGGVQRVEIYERQLECLSRVRTEYQALLASLAPVDGVDKRVVTRAPASVSKLVDPEECRDGVRLQREIEVVLDRRQSQAIELARADAAEVQAVLWSGRSDAALVRVDKALAAVDGLPDHPVIADMHRMRSRALAHSGRRHEAGEALSTGIEMAYRLGDDSQVVYLIAFMLSHLMHDEAFDEMRRWRAIAEAAIERGRVGDRERATYLVAVAGAALAERDHASAERFALEARALLRVQESPRARRIEIAAVGHLQMVRGRQWRLHDAARLLDEQLAMAEANYGKWHPALDGIYNNLGVSYVYLGQYRRGREAHRESYRRMLQREPDDADVRRSLYNQASLALMVCDIDTARELGDVHDEIVVKSAGMWSAVSAGVASAQTKRLFGDTEGAQRVMAQAVVDIDAHGTRDPADGLWVRAAELDQNMRLQPGPDWRPAAMALHAAVLAIDDGDARLRVDSALLAARAHLLAGTLESARDLLRESVDHRHRRLGPTPASAPLLSHLAWVLGQLGEDDECQQVLALAEQAIGDEPVHAHDLARLALARAMTSDGAMRRASRQQAKRLVAACPDPDPLLESERLATERR